MDFEEFLKKFIKVNDMYTPRDPSLNDYRHFGLRNKHTLLLDYREILYLFNKTYNDEDLETKVYFDLKNNDYNILRDKETQLVYNKTKHFNRNIEVPIAKLQFVDKYNDVNASLFCLEENLTTIFTVKGKTDYCLLEVTQLSILDKTITDKHSKKKVHSTKIL